MPYRKSVARTVFESRVRDLKNTALLASRKNRNIPSEVKDLTYHAAIFETSASLESYVKSLFEDFSFRIRQNGSTVDHLPPTLRTFIFIKRVAPKFEGYFLTRDEKGLLAALDVANTFYNVARSGSTVGKTEAIEGVCEERKYPSPKNWTRLYQRIGIADVFGTISGILARDAESLLDSLNDVRTEIAHETPPGLTIGDVTRHLNNMRDLVRALDRVTYDFLTRFAPSKCWPS